MKRFLAKQARRVAPRTMANMRTLSTLDRQFDTGPARFISYERELRTLRREIDELRRDNRRVAELYDAVFDWARATAATNGTSPSVDADATVRRISAEIARRRATGGDYDAATEVLADIDDVESSEDEDASAPGS